MTLYTRSKQSLRSAPLLQPSYGDTDRGTLSGLSPAGCPVPQPSAQTASQDAGLQNALLPVAMLASLLASLAWNTLSICLELVRLLAQAALQRRPQPSAQCSFYEGTVYHVRRRPLQNSFRCADGLWTPLHALKLVTHTLCAQISCASGSAGHGRASELVS